MTHYKISTIAPEHFVQLEALQRLIYPTLSAQELMRTEHFASQYTLFAAGQIVVLDGERVIGQGSGFFCNFDFDQPTHTFPEFCDHVYFRNHNPDGAYYYGADISVHPDYRGRSIGKMIYQARKALVRSHNKRGIVAGGLLPGFARSKHQMSAPAHLDKVVARGFKGTTTKFSVETGVVCGNSLQN